MEIQDAINHYRYGITHDIFKEPVTSYAKMSIEALEKQIPKKPKITRKPRLVQGECSVCNRKMLRGERYCARCGQKLNWEEGAE